MTDSDIVALLALRRWCSSLTLSSPELVPRPFGVWAWLLGLAALFVLAVLIQGPARAFGQLFDLAGHAHLVAAALGRLRRSGRLVALTFGTTVLGWTIGQILAFDRPERLHDLIVLLKTKGRGELAIEQGVLAALTPLRDVAGLGDNLILLVGATVLILRLSSRRPEPPREPGAKPGPPFSWRGPMLGLGTGLYTLYRFVSLLGALDGLPPPSLGGALIVEALVIPALMVLADGLLLAWLLAELRNVDPGAQGIDVRCSLALLPGACLACVLALPARYVATGSWLLLPYVSPTQAARLHLLPFVRGWGLVGLQGSALPIFGLAGAAAWGGRVRGYARLLRAEGGYLTATLALGSLAAGSLAALAYLLVLSLPVQPWVLEAADSYSHYVTLLVGLVILAALVELGHRVPKAGAIAPDDRGPHGGLENRHGGMDPFDLQGATSRRGSSVASRPHGSA